MSGRFSDSINGGGGNFDEIFNDWDNTEAADDFGTPIPPGRYHCILRKGELTTSRKGTLGYKLTFEVEGGEHKGRKLWHDVWLTQASVSIAKRDLGKLGITNPKEQLKQPVPKWLRCFVQAGVYKDESGVERNSVIRFEVIEKIEPEPDTFAPSDDTSSQNSAEQEFF